MKRFLKTSKKTLAVLMAVLMTMSTWVFVTSAYDDEADQTGCEHIWINRMTVKPTCTQDGYEIFVCEKCKMVKRENFVKATGHKNDAGVHSDATCTEPAGTTYTCTVCYEKTFVVDTNSEPLGHDMSAWSYVSEDPDCYYNKRSCKREGCLYNEYELTSENVKQKYYKVEYVNDKVSVVPNCFVESEVEAAVAKGNVILAADGTILANPDKYVTKVLETVYVKEGGKAEYSKAFPTRYKDKDFGKYVFAGWNASSGDLDNVTENIVAYANFDGKVMVYQLYFNGYTATEVQKITNYCANSIHSTSEVIWQDVVHGQTLTIDPAKDVNVPKTDKNGNVISYGPIVPTYDVNNLYFRYTYYNWAFESKYLGEGENIKDIKIYSDHNIYPAFSQVGKIYKAVFHIDEKYYAGGEWHTLGDAENSKTFDIFFSYGKNISDEVNAKLEENGADTKNKPSDNTYIYVFDGWVDANGVRYTDTSLAVPDGTSEYNAALEGMKYVMDKDRGIIQLYPSYIRRAKEYPAYIKVTDIDGTAAVGATVQVVGSNGYLCAPVVKTGADGVAVVNLSYDIYYEVTATYNGNTSDVYTINGNDLVAGYNQFNIDLLYSGGPNGEQAKCDCICHSYFGRLYITMLNIIYKLFGRKIVCCPDMYLTHGDQLAYGAN